MRNFLTLIEEKSKPTDIEIIDINFQISELKPVFSQKALSLHLDLAKGYAHRFNKKIGDNDFSYAGVFLHNLLFTQYREVRNNNKPNGPMFGFINKHFGSYEAMKEKFELEAMPLQGSNWIYLATDGKIKTIKNHEVRKDILLLVDWWEHAFLLDYGSDKKKYLNEQWKIINWNVINTRWGQSL
jgi:Fe-Mn family superoxide dismutase